MTVCEQVLAKMTGRESSEHSLAQRLETLESMIHDRDVSILV